MKIYTLIIISLFTGIYSGCDENKESNTDLFELTIKNPQKTYTPNDSFKVSVVNKKNKDIDSVVYYLNKERIIASNSVSEVTISLAGQKLGQRIIHAKVYSDEKEYDVSKKVSILSANKPIVYTYRILEEYPHDINSYTQGLEFSHDTLYESTGQYKQSSLRKTNYKTGEVLKSVALPDHYFGEGLTLINDKIYQLTWKQKTGFIYNLITMEKIGSFVYGNSKEGWGLCNDGETIYKSDGTQKIWTLNPNTLGEIDYIEIFTNTSKIKSVNELEWVAGKIYANIYQKDAIAIVDPTSGAVEGVIDLTDLKSHVTQHKGLDVLNGIAYNGEENILYLTGKNWDKLFKVEIVEK